jgi:hypothetical protein
MAQKRRRVNKSDFKRARLVSARNQPAHRFEMGAWRFWRHNPVNSYFDGDFFYRFPPHLPSPGRPGLEA